jgi:hypothetical protein
MSRIVLQIKTYAWLKAFGLIQSQNPIEDQKGNIILEEKDSNDIEYGLTFLKLAEKICEYRGLHYCAPPLTKSAYVPTKVTKIVNWDSITKTYHS